MIQTKHQPTEHTSLFQLNTMEEIRYSLGIRDHRTLKHRGYLHLVKNSQKTFEEDHQVLVPKP